MTGDLPSPKPMQVPRLLASDLDGTLLNAQSLVSDRTAAAVRAARDAGIEVVAATGRSHRTALPLLSPTGAFRWAICSNGATLFDVESQTVIAHNYLDHSIARAIATLADALPGAGFAWETPDGLFRDDAMAAIVAARYGNDPWASRGEPPLRESTHHLVKVLLGHSSYDLDELLAAAIPLLDPSLEVSSSGAAFIEITASGSEKGQALERLCADLEIEQADTVAFGDQINDLGMLAWVNRGFAMANAHPDVLAVTPHRAPHHDEDGVAQVIETFLA